VRLAAGWSGGNPRSHRGAGIDPCAELPHTGADRSYVVQQLGTAVDRHAWNNEQLDVLVMIVQSVAELFIDSGGDGCDLFIGHLCHPNVELTGCLSIRRCRNTIASLTPGMSLYLALNVEPHLSAGREASAARQGRNEHNCWRQRGDDPEAEVYSLP
jgi:hypothetical protein